MFIKGSENNNIIGCLNNGTNEDDAVRIFDLLYKSVAYMVSVKQVYGDVRNLAILVYIRNRYYDYFKNYDFYNISE